MKTFIYVQDKKYEEFIRSVLDVGYSSEKELLQNDESVITKLKAEKPELLFWECVDGTSFNKDDNLFQKIQAENLSVPTIVILPDVKDIPPKLTDLGDKFKLSFVSKDIKEPELLKTIDKYTDQKLVQKDKDESGDGDDNTEGDHNAIRYRRIDLKKIFTFKNEAPCDIFLELNENKSVKIIHKDHSFTSDYVDKFKSKGLEYFNIREDDFHNVLEKYSETIDTLSSIEAKDAKENTSKSALILDLVNERVQLLGIDEEVIKHTEKMNEDNVKILEKDNSLGLDIVNFLKKNNYLSGHSLYISYVALGICKKHGWNDETLRNKISFAALLHDSIFEDVELAKVGDKESAEKIKDRKKKDFVLNHPIALSEKIKEAKTNLIDVDKIVLEHHEKPDGSGFPRGLQANLISPLGCLFIMSEYFASETLEKEMTTDLMDKLLETFNSTYNKGNFKQFIPPFTEMINEVKEKLKS